MSSVVLEKLPETVAKAIRAGRALRVTEGGDTVAIVEPQKHAARSGKPARKKMSAAQWIAWSTQNLQARPDLDAVSIVRAGRNR